MSILKLNKIGYRYNDAEEDDFVFKNISYEFNNGKIYAIKGKSGSGKTTLLSILSGLERPTEGNIYYKEKNLNNINLDTYRSKNIGIIFQSYNLLPALTAYENIELSMDISKIKKDNRKEYIEDLLKKVGLSKKEGNRRVLKLSGGEQQRIAIARSLSYNPNIIIADEPTGNLDKETEKDIMKIFTHLAHKENKCVIIVTHSKSVADSSDVIYELKSNKKKIEKSE